jgi:hypothetical protein
MKYITSLSFLIIISLSSFDATAVGLQDYLQNASATTEEATKLASTLVTSDTGNESNNPLTYIIELVVAGIVASALILSLLVMFLGRWTANKEKKIIKALRIEAEQEKDNIVSAAASVREKEKETVNIVSGMEDKAKKLEQTIVAADKNNEKILKVTQKIVKREKELTEVTEHVSTRMDDIQDYWKGQLEETVSTISQVQQGLDKNLNKVDEGIVTMQRQKELSQDLLQDFLSKHQEQGDILKSNSSISEQVTENLEETFKESNKLLKLLKSHQEIAEKSLKSFAEELTVYEEQAYEQFDTTFQVADLARQELNANIDESRKHIETMRRHEEQSHSINTQTQKNLELLDYSKIMKLSSTLDSTHDMFTDIRSRVDETRMMLDELKDIESDIKETSTQLSDIDLSDIDEAITQEFTDKLDIQLDTKINPKDKPQNPKEDKETQTIYDTDYKMASGDFTPLSFFTNIKSSSNK